MNVNNMMKIYRNICISLVIILAITGTVANANRGEEAVMRQVNDVITKDQDGLAKLHMENPSLNENTLIVEVYIDINSESSPSGVYIYGEGFIKNTSTGNMYGKFELPPGSKKDVDIIFKAEKTGYFVAQFREKYYFDKDNRESPIIGSVTMSFKVSDASKNPNDPGIAVTEKKDIPVEKSPGMTIVVAILAIIIGMCIKKIS